MIIWIGTSSETLSLRENFDHVRRDRVFRFVDLRRFIENPMTQRSTTSMVGMERFWYLSEKYAERSVTMREKRRKLGERRKQVREKKHLRKNPAAKGPTLNSWLLTGLNPI